MLNHKIRQVNRAKLTAYILGWLLHLATCGAAALFVGALAQVLHAPSPLVHTLICGLIFVLTLCTFRRRDNKINRTALLLTLDREYTTTTPAPYIMTDVWRAPVQTWQNKILQFETKRLGNAIGKLVLLLSACAAVAWSGNLSPQQLLPARHYLTQLFPVQATLTVLPARERVYVLSADTPPHIELGAQELALIEITDTTLMHNPTMQLQSEGEVWQAVQLRPQPTQQGSYAVTLTIDRNSTLHIDSLAAGQALASITVAAQRTPQLKLAPRSTIADPHPDEKPLPLRISVQADNPLANIKLLITTKEGTFEELINTIIATRHKYITSYSFVPEAYMESDFAELELVAAATDRNGITGYSAPLHINAISAWGRYRHTLEKLKEVKTMLDEKISQPNSTITVPNLITTMQAAVTAANTSPFFDALDRMTMNNMLSELENNKLLARQRELAFILEKLNKFLLEHEMLNDRERDRDFFTAARHLSWIIARGDRQLKKYVQRIDAFLVKRRQRWQERIKVLPAAARPPNASKIITQEPFRTGLARLPSLSREAARDALTALVGAYRAWLAELEAAEDTHYQQLARKAEEVLQKAQNDLREMQQRQTRISTYLDKSAQREKSELQQGWAATRMRQNTNIKAAQPLLQQLQEISPLAAARLQTAVKAMQAAVASGEEGEFIAAESHADLAGRLLRHTRAATRQRLPQRRQRRRRVTADRYHGQPIIGGYIELQRDYKVNRKYREDILEEMRRSNLLEKHRDLLDAYLRKVIR